MRRFDYHKPRTLTEVFRLEEQHPGARFVAGGTDLLLRIRKAELQPPALISLRGVPELTGVTSDGRARIGAATTITDMIQHPLLRERFAVLVEAATRLGSAQIRNVATVGGNLCNASPCADTAPALLVLDAHVRIQHANGARESPLHEFFTAPGTTCLAPGELLSEILVAPPGPNARATFKKKGRVRMDLAQASVAVLLEMEGDVCRRARLAAGSVAPTPIRLPKVEALLEGATFSRAVLCEAQRLAAESVAPIDDIRASAEYRRELVGVYVRRALAQLWGRSEP